MRASTYSLLPLSWLMLVIVIGNACTAAVLDRGSWMSTSSQPTSLLHKRRVPVRTSEPDAALIADPYEQCTKYKNQMTMDLESQYPERWKTAEILPDDLRARALFEKINATAPNIAPKGDREGNIVNASVQGVHHSKAARFGNGYLHL